MKIFKLVILLSAAITISYFSWGYYTSRSHQEKHEKATLVFRECCNSVEISDVERLLCI